MGNSVFANAQEISSKSMGGKSICQFPDVCFTPPQTPATPTGVPIPYPNTGIAGDTTDGSRSVQIGGEEVMLKNRSSFKQSTGDEAGSTPNKGLINGKLKGKVYFLAWSMDVKIEGENVVRNLDMTTHNHACDPANGALPTVHAAQMALKHFKENCGGDLEKIEDSCRDDGSDQCPGILNKKVGQQRKELKKPLAKQSADLKKLHRDVDPKAKPLIKAAQAATAEAAKPANKCVQAMRCFLRPFEPAKGEAGCCPGQTPHHIPPKSCMKQSNGKYPRDYKWKSALCVCLEGGTQYAGSHGKNHAAINHLAGQHVKPGKTCSTEKYNAICAAAVAQQCGCSAKCIEDQLNKSMETLPAGTQVTHKPTGHELPAKEKAGYDREYAALSKRKPSG